MFTFLSGPTSSATFFGIGGCGGDQNYGTACNKKASALLKKAQFTADPAARNKLLHAAEVILADEVFSIPLFSRPAYLLNTNRVKSAIKNPTQQGSPGTPRPGASPRSPDHSTCRASVLHEAQVPPGH